MVTEQATGAAVHLLPHVPPTRRQTGRAVVLLHPPVHHHLLSGTVKLLHPHDHHQTFPLRQPGPVPVHSADPVHLVEEGVRWAAVAIEEEVEEVEDVDDILCFIRKGSKG